MGMIGNTPYQGQVGSGNIQDGGVQPIDLSTGAPVWTTDGKLTINSSSAYDVSPTGSGQEGVIQTWTEASLDQISAVFMRYGSDTGAANLVLGKTRSSTKGLNSIVASGDTLGQILFRGADGTNYLNGGAIGCIVTATPSVNALNAALTFYTNNGISFTTERMRLDPNGVLCINTTAQFLGGKLCVNGNAAFKGSTNQNIVIQGAASLPNAAAIVAVNDAFTANIPMEFRYSGVVAWYEDGIERFRIGASGNVGIGITNPTYKLDVLGAAQFSNPSGHVNVVASTSGPSYHPVFQMYNVVGDWDIGLIGANSFSIRDRAAGYIQRLIVDSAGSVKIPGTIFIGNGSAAYGGSGNIGAECSIQSNSSSHAGVSVQAGLSRFFIGTRYNDNRLMIGANGASFPTGDSPLMVDTNGRVTLPYQPAAHISANITYSPDSGVNNKTTYTDVKLNRGNHYSSSTGNFTCPVAGVYRVTTSIHCPPGYQPRHFIAKNDALFVGTTSFGSADWHNGGTTALIPCAANDTLSLWAFGTVNTRLHGDATWGGWNVELVG